MADKIVATLQFDEGEPLYDIDHALVMCQLHKFHRGTLYLYKKKSLYEEILKHYMEMSDLDQVVNTCRRFGDQNPALWTKTLQFVAKDCTAQPEQVTSLSIRGPMGCSWTSTPKPHTCQCSCLSVVPEAMHNPRLRDLISSK